MFEDFTVGGLIPPLPSITLTEADNALYRAITGDQHQFAADSSMYRRAGGKQALANPGLVMQYSIGQTTNATRRAIANLYYRSVRILQPVEIGQTLTTQTVVLGLKDAMPKDGQYRGRVWLGITTRSEHGPVVEYERCALIPSRGDAAAGHADEIPGPSGPTPLAELANLVPGWNLCELQATDWKTGDTRSDPLRDHIDMAAPLARLTFNQAAVHRDHTRAANGQRLVYGGHVQGLAQGSLTRQLPGLAAVVAWDGCDHLGPAYEGDLLEFSHTLVDQMVVDGGKLMRFDVAGRRAGDDSDLLKWTPVVYARV